VNKDGFSDVPRLNYLTLHPKFYHYFKNEGILVIGLSGVHEKRSGGDMLVLGNRADSIHRYFETDETYRSSVDADYSITAKNKDIFRLKTSAGYLDKRTATSAYLFSGKQYTLFSEASYLIPREHYDLVFGANFISDLYHTDKDLPAYIRSIRNNTAGVFIQHTWRIKKKLIIETGLRADRHDRFGTFILPRLALLYKINKQFSTRANAGLGYKVPNPFSKQFEEYDPTRIFPIDDSVNAERSIGAGYEFIFKKVFESGPSIFVDQSFFYNEVTGPVIPVLNFNGEVHFQNAAKPVVSYGSDTYVRISVEPFEIYLGYTYTHAEQQYDTVITTMPLYPAHRFATTAAYEPNERWRLGIEASYFGSQYTPDGNKKPGYLFMAAMIGRNINNISIVLNCENLLDFRQQNTEAVVLPPYSSPVFRPLWAPIDGRVVNLSVRLKF
jgi:outer membrane receptor for ferrienterochelin and colicins